MNKSSINILPGKLAVDAEEKTFFFWAINVINCFCAFLEIFLIAFLCFQMFQRKSEFRKAFYIILTLGFIVDFIYTFLWSLCDLFGIIEMEAIASFFEWYAVYFLGFSNFIIGFNRCTAIAFPLKHKSIWSGKILHILIISTLAFPFLINGYTLVTNSCKFVIYDDQCQDDRIKAFVEAGICNIILGILALIFVVFGILRARTLSFMSKKQINKIESRLIFKTLISSSLQIIFSASNAYASTFQLSNFQFTLFLNLGTISFIFQHYSDVLILFVVNPNFRKHFFNFYKCCYNSQSKVRSILIK